MYKSKIVYNILLYYSSSILKFILKVKLYTCIIQRFPDYRYTSVTFGRFGSDWFTGNTGFGISGLIDSQDSVFILLSFCNLLILKLTILSKRLSNTNFK